MQNIRGIVWWSSSPVDGILLPSFEEVSENTEKYSEMFLKQNLYTDPFKNFRLIQKQDNRYVIQNPPQFPLSQEILDNLYLLPFEREVHPFYLKKGPVKAINTVKFSITAVRGCYGSCAFCALTQHQTTHVVSRSKDSILEEVKIISKHKDFKGTIMDVGGPTANMYSSNCDVRNTKGQCAKFCMYPKICKSNEPNHEKFLELLFEIRISS